jgi:capsular polysaccharide transport system permease protein
MRSLNTTFRVILALVQRETLTRFGRDRLGYIWALLEPMAYIGMFLAVRGFLASNIPFGDNMALFLLTGLVAFRLSMNIAKRATGAIHSNIALLTYPMVKTFDVIVARMVLEAIIMLTVALVFFLGLNFFAGIDVFRKLEEIIPAFGAIIYLGFGMGFFNATVSRVLPLWEKVWGLLSLPLFISSGIFFLPQSLPPEFLAIVYWNPFLHAVEWLRSAAYLDYAAVTDHEYLLVFATLTLCTGLLINRFYQATLVVE